MTTADNPSPIGNLFEGDLDRFRDYARVGTLRLTIVAGQPSDGTAEIKTVSFHYKSRQTGDGTPEFVTAR